MCVSASVITISVFKVGDLVFKIFSTYLYLHIKSQVMYSVDFAFQLIADVIWGVVGIVMLLGIFNKIPTLKGYNIWSVMLIYSISMFSVGIYYVFFKNIERLHTTYILDGELEKIITRPISTFWALIYDRFNIEKAGDLIASIIILPICIVKLGVTLTITNVVMLIILLASSTAIYISIMVIFASISFWVEDRHGFLEPISTLRIFGKYPIDIYGPFLKILLTWILPFGFTAFYPAMYFINNTGSGNMMSYWTPVIALIFTLISQTIFRLGLDGYEGVGN